MNDPNNPPVTMNPPSDPPTAAPVQPGAVAPPADPPADPPAAPGVMSVEELDRYVERAVKQARREEKDKLYDDLKTLKEKVGILENERDDLQAKIGEGDEPTDDGKTTLKERVAGLQETIDGLRNDLATQAEQMRLADELDQQEKEGLKLQAYKERRMAEVVQSGQQLIPKLVGGNSQEEIEQSIERSIAQYREIENGIRATDEATRQATALAGGGVSGPTDSAPVTAPVQSEELTADQIRNMPLEEYKKLRQTGQVAGVPVDTERLSPR